MPSSAEEQLAERLRATASEVGFRPLLVGEATELGAFCQLFLKWNERINLAGKVGIEELVERHVSDAFVAARFVSPGETVIDVGSGGGLPALPLAILSPGSLFELHEPRTRRLAFLRTAVRELGLGSRVRISGVRIDRGDPSDPLPAEGGGAGFSLAMSRATWSPGEWLSLGYRLVRPEGRVMVFTTEALARELPEPAASVSYSRGRRVCVFEAPSSSAER